MVIVVIILALGAAVAYAYYFTDFYDSDEPVQRASPPPDPLALPSVSSDVTLMLLEPEAEPPPPPQNRPPVERLSDFDEFYRMFWGAV